MHGKTRVNLKGRILYYFIMIMMVAKNYKTIKIFLKNYSKKVKKLIKIVEETDERFFLKYRIFHSTFFLFFIKEKLNNFQKNY